MPLQIWFWIFYVGSLVLWLFNEYEAGKPYPFRRSVGIVLFFILLGILGWQVFGSAVK
jgi:hypothetical protein